MEELLEVFKSWSLTEFIEEYTCELFLIIPDTPTEKMQMTFAANEWTLLSWCLKNKEK